MNTENAPASVPRNAAGETSMEHSRIHSPAFWRYAVILYMLAAFLALFLLKQPGRAALLFPMIIPLSAFAYLLHELYWPGKGIKAAYACLGMFLFISVLIWEKLDWGELCMVFLDFIIALITLNIAENFFQRLSDKIADCKKQISAAADSIKNTAQQNQFYFRRIAHLKSQIWTRQELYSFAGEIGTLLDPEMIKQKLIEKVKLLFPNEKVVLKTQSADSDSIDRWVAEKKTSFLIKDATDEKIATLMSSLLQEDIAKMPFKSVIAVPLIIERNFLGLVRIDSGTCNRFLEVDLQQLELYAHLSTLALENAMLFAKVNSLATKDGLTGLSTHRVFQEKLTEEIYRAARYHTSLSLVMMDIDDFKQVNDNYGHLAGDQVLKELSQILMEQCRAVDYAARYGGEEFCMLLPEVSLPDAYRFTDNLRALIARHTVRTVVPLNITASFGVASFPQDAQTSTQLIRVSDERLYKAKHAGKNRVVSE